MPNAEKMTIEMPITGFVYDAKTDSTKIILANSFFVVFPGKWNEERMREEIEAKGGLMNNPDKALKNALVEQEIDRREMIRGNYAAQLDMLGYEPDGTAKAPKAAKVLTVDEMQATEEHQFLWIEDRYDELVYCLEAVQVCRGDGKVTEIMFNAPTCIYTIEMKGYNVFWRRWDSRPTPEQMEATPWE